MSDRAPETAELHDAGIAQDRQRTMEIMTLMMMRWIEIPDFAGVCSFLQMLAKAAACLTADQTG